MSSNLNVNQGALETAAYCTPTSWSLVFNYRTSPCVSPLSELKNLVILALHTVSGLSRRVMYTFEVKLSLHDERTFGVLLARHVHHWYEPLDVYAFDLHFIDYLS